MDASNAGSYLSSSDKRLVFGLGAATDVRSVEVRWPGNKTLRVNNPPIDRYMTINERDAQK
jgi:hypothetical protein